MRVALLMCLLIFGSEAAADTVQDLLPDCRQVLGDGPVLDEFRTGVCLGLVAGASQVLAFNCSERLRGVEIDPRLTAALPPTHGAGAQAFVNWAMDNPQSWGMDGTLGIMSSLVATFPCQ